MIGTYERLFAGRLARETPHVEDLWKDALIVLAFLPLQNKQRRSALAAELRCRFICLPAIFAG